MGRVVLVTGAARDLGSRVLRRLHVDPDVDLVVGVDVVPPRRDVGGAVFVRGDIRTPVVGRLIAEHGVDTVAHLGVLATPRAPSASQAAKEINVVGTLQVLAACQAAASVRRLVVRSTTAVYGAGPRDPALFAEDDEPTSPPRSGSARESAEVEDYVRGFGRRRPDVEVAVLRLANLVGPTIDTALCAYLSLPFVPTVLGHDPRLQLLHEDDATAVLAQAVTSSATGTVNVAGDGVLMLSQCLGRSGRVPVPVPGPLLPALARVLRQAGTPSLGAVDRAFLTYGRGIDTARMRDVLGFEPAHTTESAFASFLTGHGRGPVLPEERIVGVEQGLVAVLTGHAPRTGQDDG